MAFIELSLKQRYCILTQISNELEKPGKSALQQETEEASVQLIQKLDHNVLGFAKKVKFKYQKSLKSVR